MHQIVHIDIDTASISRNIQVDIPIVADAKRPLQKCPNTFPGRNAGKNG
ncbi:MAG: hypothetical protein ACLUVM_16110 [Blautia faecis]